MIFRINQFIHQMIFTIFIFLNVETSFVKKKNRNHIQQFYHQIIYFKSTNNYSKFQTKNLNYVSFRFVNFNVFARFNDIQLIRYND